MMNARHNSAIGPGIDLSNNKTILKKINNKKLKKNKKKSIETKKKYICTASGSECFFPYIKFDDAAEQSGQTRGRSSVSNKVNWKTLFERGGWRGEGG